MDLQNKLTSITHFLLKEPCDYFNLAIHNPSIENLFSYTVVIHYKNKEWKNYLSSTGVSKNLFEAFFKSVIELGESIIMCRNNFPDRSGIAGGLIEKNIIIRAKSELLERDAFLFHYQNEIPFLSFEKIKIKHEELIKFELETIDSDYTTIFITNSACSNGDSECLMSGVGTHLSKNIAVKKALEEYSTMKMVHEKFPQWCQNLHSLPIEKISPPDFHHLSSKDPRNKNRIKKICITKPRRKVSREFLSDEWKIKKLESPIKYFKYIKVDHPGIKKLEFMNPEPVGLAGSQNPLFHPFW